MFRILPYTVFVAALSTVGCGNDDQQSKTTPATAAQTSASPPSQAPVEEQTKQKSATAEKSAETPAPVRVLAESSKANRAVSYRVRHVVKEPDEPAAPVDSRSEKLALELLGLSLEDRLKWTQQEFEKRGIGDVRDRN